MSGVVDSESQCREGFQVLLGELLNSLLFEWSLLLKKRWVAEENGWGTTRNGAILQGDDIVWRSA